MSDNGAFDGVWITASYPGHCKQCGAAWNDADQFAFRFATRERLCADCALAYDLTLAEEDIGGEPWDVCQKDMIPTIPTAEKIARKLEKKALKREKRLMAREQRRSK